jgi:hypothetical protein
VTDDLEAHVRLVAVVRDVFRGGLDSAHVHLPPRAERRIVDRAVELLELAGWRLVRDGPEPDVDSLQAEVW